MQYSEAGSGSRCAILIRRCTGKHYVGFFNEEKKGNKTHRPDIAGGWAAGDAKLTARTSLHEIDSRRCKTFRTSPGWIAGDAELSGLHRDI